METKLNQSEKIRRAAGPFDFRRGRGTGRADAAAIPERSICLVKIPPRARGHIIISVWVREVRLWRLRKCGGRKRRLHNFIFLLRELFCGEVHDFLGDLEFFLPEFEPITSQRTNLFSSHNLIDF